MTLRAAGTALALLLCLPTAAGASTVAGRVAGGKLPKPGNGFASVRAVNVKSLAITDVAKVRKHRYRLTVPAGRYWLFAATTPFSGKPGVDRGGDLVRLRKGKRKTERISLRKPKRSKLPKLPPIPPTASAAFVTVKHPAVWIQHFSVTGGGADLQVLKKGIPQMLTSDLLEPIQQACKGVIVERDKLGVILQEIALSQSPLADPSTRLSSGKLIGHNREVGGSLTVSGGTMTLTVTVKNAVTGATRSVTRSSTPDRFFELEQSVVQETARLICGDKPPAAYSGPISGETSVADNTGSQKISWSGNVRLRFTGDVLGAIGDEPPGEYAYYEPESGSVHVIVDGRQGDCTYHGETTASIAIVRGEGGHVQQGVDDPTYEFLDRIADDAPAAQLAISGPDHCGGGTTQPFPVFGRVVLGTQGRVHSASTTLTGTASVPIGIVSNVWSWSLAPQAS
jgi:hypothetical protein